jgi:VIT1/CCC1 family predicted Fe2+/Mn2+ transporter
VTVKNYIRDIIYGASDGLVTTFAIVAGVSGASLPATVIIIIGFSKVLADAISMAAANYLGTKTEHEYFIKRDGAPEDPELHYPLQSALATFFSFILVGAVTLIPYVFCDYTDNALVWTSALTGAMLFLTGALKTKITRQHWLKGGLEMFIIGGIAAASAYVVGYLLKDLANFS